MVPKEPERTHRHQESGCLNECPAAGSLCLGHPSGAVSVRVKLDRCTGAPV